MPCFDLLVILLPANYLGLPLSAFGIVLGIDFGDGRERNVAGFSIKTGHRSSAALMAAGNGMHRQFAEI